MLSWFEVTSLPVELEILWKLKVNLKQKSTVWSDFDSPCWKASGWQQLYNFSMKRILNILPMQWKPHEAWTGLPEVGPHCSLKQCGTESTTKGTKHLKKPLNVRLEVWGTVPPDYFKKGQESCLRAHRIIDSDYTHCEEERDDKQWKTQTTYTQEGD